MMRYLVVFAAFACILAQAQEPASPPSDSPPDGPVPQEMIVHQVQQEEFVARKYLEIILKLQHTQAQMVAGSLWSKAGNLEVEENGLMSALEMESDERDLEENIFYDVDSDADNERFEDINNEQAKLDLLASYQLFRAGNIKNLQAIFHAGELQREYFLDRSLQYAVGAGAVDQSLQTLVFVKTYSTMLKTMRLSYTFQYLSHFRTWLEDSLDLNTAIVSGSDDRNALYDDANDDLARDRMWAFHAFRNYAMLDYQIFFVDSYLEYALTGGSFGGNSFGGNSFGGNSFGGNPAPPANETASFLEVEEEAQPAKPFVPFMMYNYSPAMYLKMYRFLFLTNQLQGATSAFMSAYVEQKAIEDDSEEIKTTAQTHFVHFARSLTVTAQLEYMTTMFEVYSLFAPAAAGSFGGSLAQGSI